MNTILLQPTDLLFFRDGRPMTGSLAGHGAAWPLPNVINAAFHAALHRSGFAKDAHSHRRGARGVYADDAQRDRKFGSLVTTGPFPVEDGKTWFFPRPQDLQDATLVPALLPTDSFNSVQSSLSDPLEYPVANRNPPTKDSAAKAWLSTQAFESYLGTATSALDPAQLPAHALDDSNIFDREHSIGIGIDPITGTQDGQNFYSAHYLRLRDKWQLGVCAAAEDKEFNRGSHGKDLIKALLNGGGHQIIVGGQQRICSARCLEGSTIPLPHGKTDRFNERKSKFLVKWILLTPTIWPAVAAESGKNIHAHAGGSLPNWIDPSSGDVLLKGGDTARREHESRETWRKRVRQNEKISAKLVAAIVPKPLVVTGWSLPHEGGATDAEKNGGAQSVHLAVPAGAVYYFEADSAEQAAALASTLNWHGSDTNPTGVTNRRSTLLGEKGFGLGVCGTWSFYGEGGVA